MRDRVDKAEQKDDRREERHDPLERDGHTSMLSFSPEERAEIVLTAEEAIAPSDDK